MPKKIFTSENKIIKLIADILRLSNKVSAYSYYKMYKNKEVLELIKEVSRVAEMRPDELMQIYHCLQTTKDIVGDIAEVGVYKGGSAKIILEYANNKEVHLFDTFTGLPDISVFDNKNMRKGKYNAEFAEVREYLSNYRTNYHIGLFADTCHQARDKTFSFVHLDVDLYESTRDCLEFFYPRMNKGGIIISHDYATLEGVKKAFDLFLTDKPENVLELSASQCLIIKQ